MISSVQGIISSRAHSPNQNPTPQTLRFEPYTRDSLLLLQNNDTGKEGLCKKLSKGISKVAQAIGKVFQYIFCCGCLKRKEENFTRETILPDGTRRREEIPMTQERQREAEETIHRLHERVDTLPEIVRRNQPFVPTRTPQDREAIQRAVAQAFPIVETLIPVRATANDAIPAPSNPEVSTERREVQQRRAAPQTPSATVNRAVQQVPNVQPQRPAATSQQTAISTPATPPVPEVTVVAPNRTTPQRPASPERPRQRAPTSVSAPAIPVPEVTVVVPNRTTPQPSQRTPRAVSAPSIPVPEVTVVVPNRTTPQPSQRTPTVVSIPSIPVPEVTVVVPNRTISQPNQRVPTAVSAPSTPAPQATVVVDRIVPQQNAAPQERPAPTETGQPSAPTQRGNSNRPDLAAHVNRLTNQLQNARQLARARGWSPGLGIAFPPADVRSATITRRENQVFISSISSAGVNQNIAWAEPLLPVQQSYIEELTQRGVLTSQS